MKAKLMSDIDHVEQEVLNYFRSKSGSNEYTYVNRFPYGDGYYADIRITIITGSATRVDVPVKKGWSISQLTSGVEAIVILGSITRVAFLIFILTYKAVLGNSTITFHFPVITRS